MGTCRCNRRITIGNVSGIVSEGGKVKWERKKAQRNLKSNLNGGAYLPAFYKGENMGDAMESFRQGFAKATKLKDEDHEEYMKQEAEKEKKKASEQLIDKKESMFSKAKKMLGY